MGTMAGQGRVSNGPASFSRRRVLEAGGAAALAWVVTACSGSGSDEAANTTASEPSPSSTRPASSTTAPPTQGALNSGTPPTTVFTARDFAPLGTCRVLPQKTAGPFPSPQVWERRDITEQHPGHRLRLGVQVVDEACAPLADALVSVWQCDVDGDYSFYVDGATKDDAGPGTTFLRGAQTTNGQGIVEIHTLYPGWYKGRAVHIHARITTADGRTLTTQFFFDDDLSKRVFAHAPYLGDQDTLNSQDAIAGDPAAQGTLLAVSDDHAIGGSRALIVVGLAPRDTAATDPASPTTAPGDGGRGADGEAGADGAMGRPGGSPSGGGAGGTGGSGGSGGAGQPGQPPATFAPGTTSASPPTPSPSSSTTAPSVNGQLPA